MRYNALTKITTLEDVEQFVKYIYEELGVNFHPDDDFKNYVSCETGERTMDDEKAELYNRLMDETFDVCGEEVYEIGSDLLFQRLQIE